MKLFKILYITVVMFLVIISNCSALQMTDPEKVGEFGTNLKNGNTYFVNAVKNYSSYAAFGNGFNSIYVYKDKSFVDRFHIGGNMANNTVPFIGMSNYIYRIYTNEDIVFYILKSAYDLDTDYAIIGRKKDGQFVKYIDTHDISKKYFNINASSGTIVYGNDMHVQNDTLYVDCYYYKYGTDNFPGKKLCRFYFRWDDKAQWFGIAQLK